MIFCHDRIGEKKKGLGACIFKGAPSFFSFDWFDLTFFIFVR